MKPLNLILTLLLFFGTQSLKAQEQEQLVGNWYMNDHTRLQFDYCGGWWPGACIQASSYYYDAYYELHVTVSGKEMKIKMIQLPTEYYEEENSADTIIVDSARFELFYLNDSSFSIHPIDVGAVNFLDQIQQKGLSVSGDVERNRKFYQQYVKELGKTKGKKRAEVVNRWKEKHQLYVDTAVFMREEWYSDDWYVDHDGPFIDSIFYSTKYVDNDSIHYYDFKLDAVGNYTFRNHTVARTPNDGEISPEPTDLQFIPPVVTKIYYDDEENFTQYDTERTVGDDAIAAGEGYYSGTVSADMVYGLNDGFVFYGPSRPHDKGYLDMYVCNFGCEKNKLRVYYRETYVDISLDYFRLPLLLEPFMEAFSGRWENIETFERIEGPVSFPISFSKD